MNATPKRKSLPFGLTSTEAGENGIVVLSSTVDEMRCNQRSVILLEEGVRLWVRLGKKVYTNVIICVNPYIMMTEKKAIVRIEGSVSRRFFPRDKKYFPVS